MNILLLPYNAELLPTCFATKQSNYRPYEHLKPSGKWFGLVCRRHRL